MTYEQFAYWLKGYLTGNNGELVDPSPIIEALEKVLPFTPVPASAFNSWFCYACKLHVPNGTLHICGQTTFPPIITSGTQ